MTDSQMYIVGVVALLSVLTLVWIIARSRLSRGRLEKKIERAEPAVLLEPAVTPSAAPVEEATVEKALAAAQDQVVESKCLTYPA